MFDTVEDVQNGAVMSVPRSAVERTRLVSYLLPAASAKLTLIKHGNSYNWFRRSLAVWGCFLTRMRRFIEQAKSE